MTGKDPVVAVAALQSAGTDVEALKQAIAGAMFLMDVPGNSRQKLRAAKTRLRKLLEDSGPARGGAASSSSASKLPSPHVKESYDVEEFDGLAGKYEKLNWRMISKPGGAVVKPDEYYHLYAWCMQAKDGDNTAERPMWAEKGGLDFEGRARWDAWEALKGKSVADSKLQFVKGYYEVSPSCMYKDTR